MNGLEVTADGTGVVSHAGVALVRALADNTGLTRGLSAALASARLLIHDRGRVFADLACAIADGGEAISDFRVIGDQGELFGAVASVPTAWRALAEIAAGGEAALERIRAAVNSARRTAWANVTARHGGLPGVRVADKVLAGVGCLRLDASVVPCHSDKEGAEPNFKGFGYHPLLCYCDNTREPLAGMLREGSAGRRGPHQDPGPGGRGAAAAAPSQADGHRRRCRGQPRPDRPPGQAGRAARPPGHLLGGLGAGQAGARRDRDGARGRVADRHRFPRRDPRAPRRRSLPRLAMRPPPVLDRGSASHPADPAASPGPQRGPPGPP